MKHPEGLILFGDEEMGNQQPSTYVDLTEAIIDVRLGESLLQGFGIRLLHGDGSTTIAQASRPQVRPKRGARQNDVMIWSALLGNGERVVGNGRSATSRQNIPDPSKDKHRIRSAFVPDSEDDVLIVGDYAQLELRILAEASQDDNLIYNINNGVDLHSAMGHKLLSKKYGRPVSYDEFIQLLDQGVKDAKLCRKGAKPVNFGITYGITRFKLSEDLSEMFERAVPHEEAQEYIDTFLDMYPGVRAYMSRCIADARRYGFVQTICGRFRRLSKINSRSWKERAHAENQADNAPIQGCKWVESHVQTTDGMVKLSEMLRRQEEGHPYTLLTFRGETTDYTVYATGQREVIEVATTHGTDWVTEDHRFFVADEGRLAVRRLSELSIGDYIVASDRVSECGENPLDASVAEAELIGVLCGDGSYTRLRDFCICYGNNHKWAEELKVLLRKAFGAELHIGQRRSKGSRGDSHVLSVSQKAPRLRMLDLGLGCVSREKKVLPEWILSAPLEIRVACLRGLYDSDGGAGESFPVFTSISKNLVDGFLSLCHSLGIHGETHEYSCEHAFRVFLRSEDRNAFIDAVQPRTGKSGFVWGVRTVLPPTLVSSVAEHVLASQAYKERAVVRKVVESTSRSDKSGVPVKSQRVCPYATRRNFNRREASHLARMRRIGGSAESCLRYLNKVEPSDVRDSLKMLVGLPWAQITRMAPRGVEETADIEVHTGSHSYYGNGLLQHNSAADIVKRAMIFVNADEELRDLGYTLRLQVHDELVGNCPRKNAERALVLVKDIMENVFEEPLSVPLIVDPNSADNWADAKG